MAEYINREKAKRLLHIEYAYAAEQLLDEIPAADVAPVVWCKDCKHSCKDGTGRTCEGYWYELSEFAVPVEDDDFCSYGELKMDGGADK